MLRLQELRVCVMSAPRAGRLSTFVGLEVGTRLVHPLRHRGGLAGLLGVFRDDPSAQTHDIACLSASSDACAAPRVQRARECLVFHPIQSPNPIQSISAGGVDALGRRPRAVDVHCGTASVLCRSPGTVSTASGPAARKPRAVQPKRSVGRAGARLHLLLRL